jgi:hypothetical protein
MIVSNRKLFKKRPARDNLNQAAGIMASSPELMGEVQGFQPGGYVNPISSAIEAIDFELPEIKITPGSFAEQIGMSLSGITDPNERAKLTSKSTKSVVISKVPVKLPSGELGYAVYDNGQLKGYQSEPPGTPMIDRSREIDKISKEVLKEINPSSVPRTDFSTKDLDPKLKFVNELRERAAKTDTSTRFGEDVAATREGAANLIEKYPFLRYLIPSELAKKGIGSVYDYFYGPSKTLQEQYDNKDIPLPINKDIAGIASNTGRLVDEYGTEGMEVFEPGTTKSVGATTEQIFDLISQGTGPKGDPETVEQILRQMEIDRAITPENIAQATGPKVKPEDMITRATLASKDIAQGTGPKVDEDVSKQFQQEVAEKEAAEQFAELNRLMAEGTGPKVPPEGRLSPQETSEDIAEGTGPKVPPEGRPEINKETKEAIVKQTNNIVETTTGSNLDQLMKEFTDKAPEYKGINKGLAIAKIGFAIAAGKSADGIQNIANGLSMGADMLLKDEKEKNAFDRQIALAAFKYGLEGEAAEKSQLRSDMRNFDLYVVGKEGFTDPRPGKNNKYHPPGTHIELNMADRMKYASSMESLASVKALKDYAELFGVEEMDPAKAAGIVSQAEDARGLINQAEDAVRAIGIFDEVKKLVNNPETAPFARGIKGFSGDLLTKGATFFGVKIDEKYDTQAQIEDIMLSALGDVTSVAIGNTQSANSISDRDVLLNIIKPFFGGLIQQDANGKFSVNLTSKERVNAKIDSAIALLLKKQRQSIQNFDSIVGNLSRVPSVAGYKGTGLDFIKEEQKRRSVFDIGPGGFSQENLPVFDIEYDDKGIPVSMTLVGQ